MKSARWLFTAVLAGSFMVMLASANAQDEDEQRARQLIEQIKKDMEQIDRMLMQVDGDGAATAEDASERLEDVQRNIEELLNQVRDDQLQVVENIEELVRLTKYSQSQGGGGGGEEPPPSNGEQQKNRERSGDPEVEDLKYQGQPKPRDQDQQQGDQQQGGQEPKDGRPESGEGEQEVGAKRPPGETGEFQQEDVSGRWGSLPPKAQNSISPASWERMPEKYRRIIEDYYRRSNEEQDR